MFLTLFEHIKEPGVEWGKGSNSFWHWLVLDWFTIFKKIQEVLMPRTLENDVLGVWDYTETLQEKYVLWKAWIE